MTAQMPFKPLDLAENTVPGGHAVATPGCRYTQASARTITFEKLTRLSANRLITCSSLLCGSPSYISLCRIQKHSTCVQPSAAIVPRSFVIPKTPRSRHLAALNEKSRHEKAPAEVTGAKSSVEALMQRTPRVQLYPSMRPKPIHKLDVRVALSGEFFERGMKWATGHCLGVT